MVRVKTRARLGRMVGGSCLGVTLTLPAEVSLEPDAEGETIGFKDAQLEKISDRKEINFVLAPFLRGQVPRSMTVNAADLLRKALAGSTASSGYKVNLDRLKIQSIQRGGRQAGGGCGRGFERGVRRAAFLQHQLTCGGMSYERSCRSCIAFRPERRLGSRNERVHNDVGRAVSGGQTTAITIVIKAYKSHG